MRNTIKKSDLVDHLHKVLGFNKRESKELVEIFLEEIVSSLVKNEDVKLSGFGNFQLIDKKERIGRNPKTGEPALITARKVITFRAGQKLRKQTSLYDGK